MTHLLSDEQLARRAELSTILGRPFELESLVGIGGQAEVWRGRDAELNRPVAIKVVRADVVDRPDVGERLRREAVSIARIQSPYVVPILQLVSREGLSFLVMPLVAGQTLAAVLARGKLPVNEAIRVVRDVALGLADAHNVGIVHRDVKPSNIILDETTGVARLMDFGIAKASESGESSLTLTGAVVGSAVYMSPEQFDGSAAIGPPSDIYSLGVVAFETVTGRPPFTGKTLGQLALQHSRDAAPSLATFDIVHGRLEELIDHCLSKTPVARPTAREVADRLVTMDAESEQSNEPVTRSRSIRFVRFVLLLITTIVLSVLALVFKGTTLVMLKALLKTLLQEAIHLL